MVTTVVRSFVLLPSLLLLGLTNIQDAGAANDPILPPMQAAAKARQVPLPLIEAIAYVDTRWEWIDTPARDGGVGPMNILAAQIGPAAALSGRGPGQVASDLAANLDAGAALLASAHTGGADLSSWRSAVVSTQGPFVAQQIYDVLSTGATRTTSTGETIVLAAQPLPPQDQSSAVATAAASGDYPPAGWVPASVANYSAADRPHDDPVDMIIIHDIEGSYGSAIQLFQNPNTQASAHYVVSYQGQITQMVAEHDIAWHAGNWDYNTRAIGIEHEGFAGKNLYTLAEYQASAQLAASICSRWGVPLDRTHVIGHYQVPDPFNPGLFGGAGHHTDPGPYWNWSYYMGVAQTAAGLLPSPPHMAPDPVATNGVTSATVTWQAARSCHDPITRYTVVGQPGNLTQNLPAGATSATFTGLQKGVSYTFTVTAFNSEGQDSLTSNPVSPSACTTADVTPSIGSPQPSGTQVRLTATAGLCPNPLYEFWIQNPGSDWQVAQPYSPSATYNWNTTGKPAGSYGFVVWAKDASSPVNYDTFSSVVTYTLAPRACTAAGVSASPTVSAMAGATVTITGSASGCPNPSYEFWILNPGSATWQAAQPYSSSATFAWNTTGKQAGGYLFAVWARDASSPANYDALSAGLSYTLASSACSAAGIAASPPSAALAGTPVTITGRASGCPSPSYEFWVLSPGSGTWQVAQPYSTNATFNWSTTGKAAGAYTFVVWARTAGSAANYEAFSPGLGYALRSGACTAAGVSASPVAGAAAGAAVTILGSAGGCPSPTYEFWILAPGSSTWQVAQPYSSGPAFNWSTAGKQAGGYRFVVWTRNAGSPANYEAFSTGLSYTLS